MAKPKSDIVSQTYEWNGTEYSFAELCLRFGVKYNSVYSRMRNKGMTITEAIDDCLGKPKTWGATFGVGKKMTEG